MSKRDLFHYAVRHALERDGWTITDDPLRIEWGGATIKIDLGAERLLAAEREGEKSRLKSRVLQVGHHCQSFIPRLVNLSAIDGFCVMFNQNAFCILVCQ